MQNIILEIWKKEIDQNNCPTIDETYPNIDESRLDMYMNTMAEKGATGGVGRNAVTGKNSYEKVLAEMETKMRDTIGINHKVFKDLQEKKYWKQNSILKLKYLI